MTTTTDTTKTPQTPAEGIMLHKDHGSSKFYKVSCECGNSDDEIMFDVEADDYGVTAHHYVKVKSNWWDETWSKDYDIENPVRRWLQNNAAHAVNTLIHRVKITWKLWVHGYVEYEAWTMMSKQQTLNYGNTLLKAVDDVEAFRVEYKNKIKEKNRE